MTTKKMVSTSVIFLFLIVSFWFSAEALGDQPITISPGNESEAVTVWQNCPTFSWSLIDRAASYRIAIFKATDPVPLNYEEIASLTTPVLMKHIAGKALSCTLSSEESLETGNMYLWYVQALDESGKVLGNWSKGRLFLVEAEVRFIGIEEKMEEILRSYGVSEDVISNTLNDMKSEVSEIVLKNSGTNRIGNGLTFSLRQGVEGPTNTYYGQYAGFNTTTAHNNTFIGVRSGYNATTAYNDVFIGSDAGFNNNNGINNAFLGVNAGRENNAGSYNTFIGCDSAYNNTNGNNNTCLGYGAGYASSDGSDNTFLGNNAGQNNTGNANTYVGSGAGIANFTGYSNTFLGYYAGYLNMYGHDNIMIGYRAGYDNRSGSTNTIIGYEAGGFNDFGCLNILMGYKCGYNIAHGIHNVIIGNQAGYQSANGNFNLVLGDEAGYMNVSGGKNVLLGYQAGRQIRGDGNIFIGYNAGYNEIFSSNRLYISNSDTTTPLIYGEFDNNILSVNGKLGVGTQTPVYPVEVNTIDSDSTLVVSRSGGASNCMIASTTYADVGTLTNSPLRLIVDNHWRMCLRSDNSLSMNSGAKCTVGGVWTNASSRALKENIEKLTAFEALNTLAQMTPVKYNYISDKTDPCVGFIAEDVPELVATPDRKGLSPMDVTAVLTKVVQEQQAVIQKQAKVNSDLLQKIATLLKRMDDIEKKLK